LQRRQFLAGLAVLGSSAAPLARAQPPANRPARIGIFHFGSAANFRGREEAFKREMQNLGYTEARAQYYTEGAYGQRDLLEQTARTFVRERFDVIVSSASITADALRRAAPDTPIVIIATDDPVAEKFAESLQHPGHNFTGINVSALDHLRRQLDLLERVHPRLTRVIALLNPDNAAYSKHRARLEGTARAATRIVFTDARDDKDLERAFPVRPNGESEGLLVMNDPFFFTERRFVAELVARAKHPAIYPARGFVEAGGLMSHGPNPDANAARAAHFVDRILKGDRPADIPFELPPRLELVLNRDVAANLKLTFPPDLLKEAATVVG
jgi:putative ABC transport system substrate-binding protein